MARPGSRIPAPARAHTRPAGIRTDPARANSGQETRDRTVPATRATAMAGARRAGLPDGEDPDRWAQDRWGPGKAVLDGLTRVLVSMVPGTQVAPRTAPARGHRAADGEHAGRAAARAPRHLSRPRDNRSLAAGQAASATRRATGSILAAGRPGRGTGQAAP